MREGYPIQGEVQKCRCVSDHAVLEVGDQRFDFKLSGFMEVEAGEPFVEEGLATVPLRITGHRTSGSGDGIGAFQLEHDPDPPLPESRLQELTTESGFPAIQDMHVNVKITLEQIPGVTLRNVSPGTLRNSNQESWPPQDARYELQEPMELENADQPGQVIGRILSYTARINPAED